MSNITKDPISELINQTTESNIKNNKIIKIKTTMIKIEKQMEKPKYKLKKLILEDNKDFVTFEDEKKNEDIVLNAIQDKWYIEFNRLIYSKKYSYIILVALAMTCLLIVLSLSLICSIFNNLCIIVLLSIISFSFIDILIRYYIMVKLY